MDNASTHSFGHNDKVHKCSISPDRKYVLSASDDQTLKVWDLENGRCKHTLRAESDLKPNEISFFQDGKWILCQYSRYIKAWDIESGLEKYTLYPRTKFENWEGFKISPNGKWIAFSTSDSNIKVFNSEGKYYFEIENSSINTQGFILENTLFFFSQFTPRLVVVEIKYCS